LVDVVRRHFCQDRTTHFSRFTYSGDFLHNCSGIRFTLRLALPDARRFIVPLWALSCKIPSRTALVLLSCGRPSRWPPDLLLRSTGRNAQAADFRWSVTKRLENQI
jgi:hypothetical protein